MSTAQHAGQPGAGYADPAAVDAWALIARRLRGDVTAEFTPSDDAPGHSARILGWVVEIAAAGMAAREHDLGWEWKEAFPAALRTAEARLEAARTAPDLQALARLAGASALRRAPRPPAAQRSARRRR